MSEGISEGTVHQYEENFGFFRGYVEKHGNNFDVEFITHMYIREWAMYMQFKHVQYWKVNTRKEKEIGLKPATINTRIKTLRVMFNTLQREKLIVDNRMSVIKNVYEPEQASF